MTRVITAGDEGVYIEVQVQSKARRPGVRGVHDQRLKVAVAEPPEAGRANTAALQALADVLNVPSSTVSLVAGKTSKHKRVFVRGMSSADARERIAAAVDSSGRA